MKRVYFPTTYYSDLWYSRHYRPNFQHLAGNLIKNEVEHHKATLRILSLFFDHIYIPRTHFITQKFSLQHEIPNAVIDSEEFKFLLDHDVLRISSLPGLDSQQDTERITQRRKITKRVIYPTNKAFLGKIPTTKKLEVDTRQESISNTISFPKYGEILGGINKAMGKQFLEIVKRSEVRDIPFFHEHYINLLREKFPDETFETVWRETNSIYLTSGAPEHADILPYYNEDIESSRYRFSGGGVDRFLFSPASLLSFLSIFLSENELSRFCHGSISKTHAYLYAESSRADVGLFRREYQYLVWNLSPVLSLPNLQDQRNQEFIRKIFSAALLGKLENNTNIAQEILRDIEGMSKVTGAPNVGLLALAVNAALRYGNSYVQDVQRRQKFPNISNVMRDLRKILKSVKL